MPFIGNQPAQESIQDKRTYTGNGTNTVYGVTYTGGLVQVYQNGIKLRETTDYTLDSSGLFVSFTVAPESGDTIDLIGTNDITDLARSSYVRESFTSTANQTVFTLNSNISASDKINVHINGMRLKETDYTLNFTNNTVTFALGRQINDVIAIEIVTPGFRSDQHFTRGDKAHHLGFANPTTLLGDMTVDTGENALIVGPVTINSVVTVNGNLTII
tara:strand:- start:204 stop:851 length:648 start_codon:yes stop_codon:yes gene_type:complete